MLYLIVVNLTYSVKTFNNRNNRLLQVQYDCRQISPNTILYLILNLYHVIFDLILKCYI